MDTAFGVGCQIVGLGQRRECALNTLAFGLVTGQTVGFIHRFTELDLLFLVGGFGRTGFYAFCFAGSQRYGLDGTAFRLVNGVADFAGEDFFVFIAFYHQLTQRTFVKRAEDRVVNQGVAARNVDFEVDNGRAARRNQRGLDIFVNQIAAFNVHGVEDFTNHVERRHQVRTAVTDKHTHFLTHFGFERIVAGNRADVAVEHHIIRLLFDGFFHVERLQAAFAVFAFGIEVALNHVEFFIHFRQAFFRLNQEQAVHTVGDVHAYRRGGAVVDIESGLQRFEAES